MSLRFFSGRTLTAVLAGLISDEQRQASNRIPGLGDLPMLGRLFSSQRDEKKKSELVLSITPHVVRVMPHADPRLAEFTFGSDSVRGSSMALKSSDDSKGGMSLQPQVGESSPVTPPAMAPTRPYAPPDLNSPPATLDPSAPATKSEPVPQEQPDPAGTDTGAPEK